MLSLTTLFNLLTTSEISLRVFLCFLLLSKGCAFTRTKFSENYIQV